jgi:hypothetical protein
MAMMLAAFSFSGCSTFSIHILAENNTAAASRTNHCIVPQPAHWSNLAMMLAAFEGQCEFPFSG